MRASSAGRSHTQQDKLTPSLFTRAFAGRCLCATTGAMTSARVIGTAMASGWAAGMAAAVQATGRPLEEAVKMVQDQMLSGL
jgi:hypothetical protein